MLFVDLACLLRLLGRFSCHKILLYSTHFRGKLSQRDLSVTPVMPYHYDRIAYAATMQRFHWGRDIGCLPSPPYHWSCMSDHLLMWHNAAYSVCYAQRQVSASLWNARAYSRRSTYFKSVYKHYTYWHEGYRADIKVIALQALTTTVCDKLLNANATRWEEHKQPLPPFVTVPWLEEEICKFRCMGYENE